MSFQSGTVKRTKPVLMVNNGYDPMSPQSAHRQLRLPVAADDVSVIKSGMVIAPVWNSSIDSYEWKAGIPSGYSPEQVAFANADGDDYDVVAAGGLPGLLSSGMFDLTTGYFADNVGFIDGSAAGTDQTYNSGVYLTPCTDADVGKDGEGEIKTAGQLRGYLKTTVLESSDPIVGVCHGSLRGPFNLGPVVTGTGASENDAGTRPGTNSSAKELNVIRLLTRSLPNTDDATGV